MHLVPYLGIEVLKAIHTVDKTIKQRKNPQRKKEINNANDLFGSYLFRLLKYDLKLRW